MYRDGPVLKRDLRAGPEGSRFHPTTLKNHLQHLKDQRFVRIERIKNSDLCGLTASGEKVAARVIANETGIPVGEKLGSLLGEANSRTPTIDDFTFNVALPSGSSAPTSGAHTEQIKFHRRRRLGELDWHGKGPNLSGVKIPSIMENLDNLSSTSARDASVDLRTIPDPGWQTVQRGTAKLRPPVTDPGLSPNDWQQRARRRFELDSTFKEVPPETPLPQ